MESPGRQQCSVCVNPNCRANKNLMIAPSFVKAYYGLAIEGIIVRKVCEACYESAEGHQNQLVVMLLSKQSIALHGPKKPNNQVQVVSLDDDEDAETVEEHVEPSEELEVEEDFELFVQNIMEKYKFNDQLESSIQKLESNLADNDVKQSEIDDLTAILEKDVDQFRKELYSNYEPQIQHLDAIDITEMKESNNSSSVPAAASPVLNPRPAVKLPPIGVFNFLRPKNNQSVYAMRNSLLAPWKAGHIVRKAEEGPETLYIVQFENGEKRKFPLKYLAYVELSSVQLTVGSRVIAQCFEDNNGKIPSAYYAGVIAEALNYLNQYRYLVFFDDGYAQYCHHEQVLMVCHSSRDVWHDVHVNSRFFVAHYLKQFPERAMVRLQTGQKVKAELNGRWFTAVVHSVDASLVRIFFASEKIFQWIYRGSTRLHPLFEMLEIAESRRNQGASRPTHNLALINRKKNTPYVEFTFKDVDPTSPSAHLADNIYGNDARAVARKSSESKSMPKSSSFGLSQSKVFGKKEDKGKIVTYQNEMHQSIPFEPHQCGPLCVSDFSYTEADFKNVNHLSIPMKCGWSREVTKRTPKGQRNVVYRGPCGRRMRNFDEVHRYLRLTRCELSVDLFCFENFVHCFAEFQPDDVLNQIEDISYGKEERVLVSCVNSIDTSLPDYVEYTTQRIPREGVDLNLDTNFLVCCDCTDDCQDKEKCQCWQLTLQSCGSNSKANLNAGYQFRRLKKRVPAGVYECNSQCSCRKTCLNRVAQRPLQLRLQLFRTEKRGWGIRCLDDIPSGQFICVYTGHVLTEQEANKDGKQYGDEYLFDLDLIETCGNTKEGYESDAASISSRGSDDSELQTDFPDGDSCDSSSSSKVNSSAKQNLIPSESMESKEVDLEQVNKTRELYGENELCFVMDAKSIGNIGRYLNHSCSPNIFAQNVFLDSQDLRFHWVGLFADSYIRAGKELTWDYGYQVGSVKDKTIICHCGAQKCRGRLL